MTVRECRDFCLLSFIVIEKWTNLDCEGQYKIRNLSRSVCYTPDKAQGTFGIGPLFFPSRPEEGLYEVLEQPVKLPEAFQLVNSGPRKKQHDNNKNWSDNNKGNYGGNNVTKSGKNKKERKYVPICLCETQKQIELRNYLRDCRDCTEEEKTTLLPNVQLKKCKRVRIV